MEYEGARYHVMCRGNQGKEIFKLQADADLFIRTLGEMCERNQMQVHAWCLMSNHYHLLLETPLGNLVNGMKWMQGTFTQRYNARYKLWGHLFQGRYKAKVVSDDEPEYFRKVSEYIHLNPADAGLVKQGELKNYLWSSFPFYLKPRGKRPDCLKVLDVLRACEIPADTPAGRRAYEAYMAVRQMAVSLFEKGSHEQREWDRMERGWVHGSAEFRKRMVNCLAEGDVSVFANADDVEQKRDLGEAAALIVLDRCLDYFQLTSVDLNKLKKSDERKMLIAGLLRYHFPLRADRISALLHMGHFTTVSRAMKFYDNPSKGWRDEKIEILNFIG